MVKIPDLNRCNRELFVYDVTQRAWEQEPNGLVANVRHVLTHLVKDAGRKNFRDEKLVSRAIAPDNLMYGLRLSRWGNITPRQLGSSFTNAQFVTEVGMENNDNPSKAFTAHAHAVDMLAGDLHDRDHEAERERVEDSAHQHNTLLEASRPLVYSATLHEEEFGFSLEDAFMDRLAHLRERFDIPQPE